MNFITKNNEKKLFLRPYRIFTGFLQKLFRRTRGAYCPNRARPKTKKGFRNIAEALSNT